jgi:hypothetical protein
LSQADFESGGGAIRPPAAPSALKTDAARQVKRRVVLLGASNLTRGISVVVDTARKVWGSPLDVYSAIGHGRSYGILSNMLHRKLPGILQCGLWDALAAGSQAPTSALITDIGNDLLYEVEVRQIVAWVDEIMHRLQGMGAQIGMTLLPVTSAENISARRFYFFRTIFFPKCRLSLAEVRRRAIELHDQLEDLGRRRGVRTVDQQTHWYGFDPIHIRRRHWRHAWREILSACHDHELASADLASGSMARWMYLISRAPERQWFFGLERQRKQPHARLPDGTTVAFF